MSSHGSVLKGGATLERCNSVARINYRSVKRVLEPAKAGFVLSGENVAEQTR